MLRICPRYSFILKRPAYTKNLLRHYSIGRPAEAAQPPRILFFGSDTFSIVSLEKLRDAKQQEPDLFESINIVTREPAPSGRGLQIRKQPVQIFAETNSIPFQTVAAQSLSTFQPVSFRYDLLVAVSFGLFIPSRIIQSIPHSINVHPSLLPQYRGPAPIHHAILNGDRHTGVTLQTVSPKGFDRGIIFDQSFAIAIEEDEKLWDLWQRLAVIGADMLVSSIQKRSYINPVPVNTFTKESEAGKILPTIDWYQVTGDRAERQSRLFPLRTGAIDIRTGKRVLINLRGISHRKQQGGSRAPGAFFLARERESGDQKMVVVCTNRDTVFVDAVQASGRGWISGVEFVNSSPDRFWGSRFVPWRREYDEHDPSEYRWRESDPPPTPSIPTNPTESAESNVATAAVASTLDTLVE